MKSNILLGFVAASLAFLAYTERQTVPSPTPVAAPEQPSESLFSLQPQEIDVIKVLDPRGCIIVRREAMLRQGGERLVESIVQARVVRRFSPPSADLSSYGLASPTWRIKVQWANSAHSRDVEIGNLNPVGNAVYVHVNDESAVLLVGSYFVTSLNMALQGLRAADSKLINLNCSAEE